jgi:hypothetical protein
MAESWPGYPSYGGHRGIVWVDSRYPALLKRYHSGTQIKASGALTFGAVYRVDPGKPLATRVFRTTVTVLATMFASPALNVVVLAMTFALFPVSVALVKLATVLFLIFVFAPLVSSREQTSRAPVACPIEFPATETWAQVLSNTVVLSSRASGTLSALPFRL